MKFEQYSKGDLERRPEIVDEWRNLMSRSSNLYSLYQSPEWWSHLSTAYPDQDLMLAAGRNDTDGMTAAIALCEIPVQLKVSLARRSLGLGRVRCLEVMGSEPNLPENPEDYRAFFDWIWHECPRAGAIYFKSIRTDGFCWKYLESSGWKVGPSFVHRISEIRPFHSLTLPGSFDEYIGTFKKKKRYNLKRQVRLMEEASDGGLLLEAISLEDQVGGFCDGVREIARKSWKEGVLETAVPPVVDEAGALEDIARHGLLRSYLLKANGVAVAFVLGYQYGDVYHYSDIGFDESVWHLSPGNVLLFLLIKEIIENSRLRRINFGIEDRAYKRQFGNIHVHDASLLIMRPSLRNRRIALVHGAARGLKETIRRVSNRG